MKLWRYNFKLGLCKGCIKNKGDWHFLATILSIIPTPTVKQHFTGACTLNLLLNIYDLNSDRTPQLLLSLLLYTEQVCVCVCVSVCVCVRACVCTCVCAADSWMCVSHTAQLRSAEQMLRSHTLSQPLSVSRSCFMSPFSTSSVQMLCYVQNVKICSLSWKKIRYN